jgi:hypothetical protein
MRAATLILTASVLGAVAPAGAQEAAPTGAPAATPAPAAPPASPVGAAAEPARRRGFLAMPLVGLHGFQGSSRAASYGNGFRMGALLGAHLTPLVSLNAELLADFLNPSGVPGGSSGSGTAYTLALSPLFHAAGRLGEIVVGPKFGYWGNTTQITTGMASTQSSLGGWVVGMNAGVFVGLHDVASVGLLLSYQFVNLAEYCFIDATNMTTCPAAASPRILGFAAAAMF